MQERIGVVPFPISFPSMTSYKNEDDNSVMSLKLCSDPTDKNIPQCDMQAKLLATSVEEQFIWCKQGLYKIISGQNLRKPQDKLSKTEWPHQGDALVVFDRSAMSKDHTQDAEFEGARAACVHEECIGKLTDVKSQNDQSGICSSLPSPDRIC